MFHYTLIFYKRQDYTGIGQRVLAIFALLVLSFLLTLYKMAKIYNKNFLLLNLLFRNEAKRRMTKA